MLKCIAHAAETNSPYKVDDVAAGGYAITEPEVLDGINLEQRVRFTSGGRLTYQPHGKTVYCYDFDAFVSDEIGDIAFQSRAINRLFASKAQW